MSHLTAQVVEFGDAAAGFAQHARRVALVHHHQRVVFLGQRADLVQRRGIAVHREDPVGADDAETLRLRLLETLLQLGHVGVGVAVAHGLAQTHAVDDRRMVQRVGDNGVLLTENRFEDASVGVEAGGVEDRVLGAEVVGYGFFELFVDVLTAADETHRRHAVAAVVHGPFRGFDQPRVVRKSEVVVGAEIKYLTTCNFDLRALRRFDDPFALVEPCSLDFGKFLLQMFFDFSVHIRLWFDEFPVREVSIC